MNGYQKLAYVGGTYVLGTSDFSERNRVPRFEVDEEMVAGVNQRAQPSACKEDRRRGGGR